MAEMNGQDPQHEEQLEGQDAGQNGQMEQAPQVDELDQAYRVIADREGWDPRLTRFQMEELKSRREEVERKERELRQALEDSRRPRHDVYQPELSPEVSFLNSKIDRVAQILEEERTRRQEREEMELRSQRDGMALHQSYAVLMRQSGVPEREIESRAPKFFQAMEQLYPEGIPERIGIEGAVRNTHQFMSGGRPYQAPSTQTTTTRITPRTAIVTAQGTGPVEDRSDLGPQRQGESNNDYAQRVLRNYESLGLKGMSLKDGERISSE